MNDKEAPSWLTFVGGLGGAIVTGGLMGLIFGSVPGVGLVSAVIGGGIGAAVVRKYYGK